MDVIEQSNNIFASKLKKVMTDKNISSNKLSKIIGLDRASISKYLSGESSPRINTFLLICEALDVQPNYFLNPEYEDYSKDNSKTVERKIIESLYFLCKAQIIEKKENIYDYNRKYDIFVYEGSLLDKILNECLVFANTELADDFEMSKKIADKYEYRLINEMEKEN